MSDEQKAPANATRGERIYGTHTAECLGNPSRKCICAPASEAEGELSEFVNAVHTCLVHINNEQEAGDLLRSAGAVLEESTNGRAVILPYDVWAEAYRRATQQAPAFEATAKQCRNPWHFEPWKLDVPVTCPECGAGNPDLVKFRDALLAELDLDIPRDRNEFAADVLARCLSDRGSAQ